MSCIAYKCKVSSANIIAFICNVLKCCERNQISHKSPKKLFSQIQSFTTIIQKYLPLKGDTASIKFIAMSFLQNNYLQTKRLVISIEPRVISI